KPYLADGLVKLLATLSASGSALLMLHFLRRLAALPAPEGPRPAPVGLVWPWAVAGIAAVAMPWALYAVMPGGRPAEALTAQALWAALWPVLVGAGLALALFRWGRALPAVPEGDVICYGERAAREVVRWSARADTADSWLRRWPVAGAAALALALALAALLAGGLSPARDAGTPAGGAGLPRAGRPRSNAPRMDDGGLFPETRWCAGLPRVGLVALLCLAAPAGTAAEARLVTDGFAPEGAAAAHVLRTRTWLFLGPAARWGAALAAPGDITGDGLADLVVASAPAEGAPARPTAVLVIAGDRGKRPRTFRVSAPSGTDLLAAAGDVDGDGAPEWLLGRRGDAATPAVLELRGG
ncbi:MAG TPA: VCBS repeat-containing protein, partial [Verrucomicrobiota bacterium]|nr:VCBS repeat-containing protein [Verrucomicrobiota bacterium]